MGKLQSASASQLSAYIAFASALLVKTSHMAFLIQGEEKYIPPLRGQEEYVGQPIIVCAPATIIHIPPTCKICSPMFQDLQNWILPIWACSCSSWLWLHNK